MKKIELEIVALSHSITQTHSYAVVLGEVNGLTPGMLASAATILDGMPPG